MSETQAVLAKVVDGLVSVMDHDSGIKDVDYEHGHGYTEAHVVVTMDDDERWQLFVRRME